MSGLSKREMLQSLRKSGVVVPPEAATKLPGVRSTIRYTDEMGCTYLRYSETNVIKWYQNGNVRLDSGGWRTVTTKKRINDHLHSITVFQTNNEWFVRTCFGTYPFFDGILIDCNGTVLNPRNDNEQKVRKALLKKVETDFNKIKEFEEPSLGDCFYCQMETSKLIKYGRQADLLDSSDHITSHIEEAYYHGTLAANALLWAGYRQEAIGWLLREQHNVKRSLKRYLKFRIGCAV